MQSDVITAFFFLSFSHSRSHFLIPPISHSFPLFSSRSFSSIFFFFFSQSLSLILSTVLSSSFSHTFYFSMLFSLSSALPYLLSLHLTSSFSICKCVCVRESTGMTDGSMVVQIPGGLKALMKPASQVTTDGVILIQCDEALAVRLSLAVSFFNVTARDK